MNSNFVIELELREQLANYVPMFFNKISWNVVADIFFGSQLE